MAKKYLRGVAGVIGISLLLCAGFSSSSFAAGSWTDPFISTTTQTSYEERDQSLSPAYEYVHINTDKFTRYRMHVVKGVDVSLAYYTDGYQNHWFVKFTYQQYYAAITNTSQGQILNLVSGTNTLVVDKPYGANYGEPGLITSLDIRSVLKPVFSGGEISYVLDLTTAKRWFSYTTAWGEIKQKDANDWVVSSDGRYMLASMSGGYYKIDLSTQKIEDLGRHGDLQPNSFALAISNGGKYVFVSGPEFIDTTTCSIPVTEEQVIQRYSYSETGTCSAVNLRQAVSSKVGYTGYDGRYRWVDNDSGIEFFVQSRRFPDGSDLPLTKVTLRQIEKTQDDNQLDYLALGDSYSSGEGDIEKDSNGRNHYLALTDIGKDTCHVSSRSYPFLLRDYWGIDSTRMKSVACSGARVLNDYDMSLEGYFGQNNQLRERSDIEDARQTALDRFIPGRIPQLEFIKKYKPKVITLTGSGNDVGFADILVYCASDVLETFVFGYECEYVDGGDLHQVLWDAIHTQYSTLTKLIQDIKQASPDSRIYLIGYPSFISGSEASCAVNNGSLSGGERDMINSAVSELDNVERKVAFDTGINFVDIEDSLNGGRLCESNHTRYVTGVMDSYLNSQTLTNGSFHPNAKGHEKIADAIEARVGSDPYQPLMDDPSPSIATWIVNSVTYQYQLIGQRILEQGYGYRADTDTYVFQPESEVDASLHSDPIDLGQYRTDTDGALHATINIPADTPPGRHVLTLKGTSLSGEPITLYQFVTVGSGKPNDIDGDGILDENDRCEFITHWYDDEGIDTCSVSIPAQDSNSIAADQHNKPTRKVNVNNLAALPNQDQDIFEGDGNSADSSKDLDLPDPHVDRMRQANRPIELLTAAVAIGIIFCGIIITLRRMYGKTKKE